MPFARTDIMALMKGSVKRILASQPDADRASAQTRLLGSCVARHDAVEV